MTKKITAKTEARSAVTGRYVTLPYANSHPRTTVVENRKQVAKPPARKK